jgi:tripartite-type tricarboxylate transporter receptor subunit TctC
MKNRISLVSLALLLAFSLVAMGCPPPEPEVPEVVEPYPTRPITVVVPWAVGGGSDRLIRALSIGALDHFGQPWRVVNMPGGGSTIGTKHAMAEPPDGYTIVQGCPSQLMTRLVEGLPPIEIKIACIFAWYEGILLSRPGTPWETWEGFKAYVEAHPGKITVGAVKSGLLVAEFLLEQVGLADKMIFVPYGSTADAVADFLGGHIHLTVVSASTGIPLIPEKAVAVVNTSEVPIVGIPEYEGVPSALELGLQGLGFPRYLAVPPDTPDEIVDFISERVGRMAQDPAVTAIFRVMGEPIAFEPRAEAQATWDKIVERVKQLLKAE